MARFRFRCWFLKNPDLPFLAFLEKARKTTQRKQGFFHHGEPLKSLGKKGKTLKKSRKFLATKKSKEIQKSKERKIRERFRRFRVRFASLKKLKADPSDGLRRYVLASLTTSGASQTQMPLKQGSNHLQTLMSRKYPFSNQTNPHLQIPGKIRGRSLQCGFWPRNSRILF